MVSHHHRRDRALAGIAVGAVLVAACGGGGRAQRTARDGSAPVSSSTVAPRQPVGAVAVAQIPSSPKEHGPSGLSWALGGQRDGIPEPSVPLTEIHRGGPPPDGIPPVDAPRFLPSSAVSFLADHEPVLAVDIDGEARAYPVQILVWHEIVNDTVAGVPVAITYCPLCNSAVAYDRRVGARVLDFGTSGMLWNSSLVMYDRQTETLWSHYTGQGVAGVLTGTTLQAFPVATVPWRVWRDGHPNGMVLSRETGYDREYGRNPYPGYDNVDGKPFLYEGKVDGRFTAMTRVVGINNGGDAVAVPLSSLRQHQVMPVALGGRQLVLWWAPGTVSALDATRVSDGADIGATGVFVPTIDGRILSFTASVAGFVDRETSSTWDLLGRATAGPLTGRQLQAVEHVDTFWFAWSAFRPATALAG